MRITAVVLTCLVTGLGVEHVFAQIQKFPYEAVVVQDDALVRSGDNEDYYPTMRLRRDDLVTVHREDRGGWLAIEPPAGSFSWIRAKYVERNGADAGTVTEDGVVIFVGSAFEDEASVWQRKATTGERLTVLGEQELLTEAGPRKMYRIAPPVRERRWISGEAVVPVHAATRKQHDEDPFKTPSTVRRRSPRDVDVVDTPALPSARLQRLQQIRAEQRELAEIDQRFRLMLDGSPATWDLQSLETEYNNLRNSATWRPVAGQIDLRFHAIDRYRQRKAEYEDFKRLTSQTERRDAELLASQFGAPDESADYLATSPERLNTATANPRRSVIDMPEALVDDSVLHPDERPPVPDSDFQELRIPPTGVSPASQYIGAGIVRRLPEGGYVLTSPNGRRLAKLEDTESIRLEEFVGRSVGLHGKRWYRDDISSDYIQVMGLEPVRIR